MCTDTAMALYQPGETHRTLPIYICPILRYLMGTPLSANCYCGTQNEGVRRCGIVCKENLQTDGCLVRRMSSRGVRACGIDRDKHAIPCAEYPRTAVW